MEMEVTLEIGFVEDHVDALLAAIKGKSGSNYCIGGNSEMKNIDLSRIFVQLWIIFLKIHTSIPI